MNKKILVINGPNLNMLGERETEIYGKKSWEKIKEKLEVSAIDKSCEIEFFQSNFEGEIIEKIQKAKGKICGLIINPAALGITSYSIYDAIRAVKISSVEVHITNIFNRENFRKKSITAAACDGVISGLGWRSYLYALFYLIEEKI